MADHHNPQKLLALLCLAAFAAAIMGVRPALAQMVAQTAPAGQPMQPLVETHSIATSSSVSITMPAGYNGRVYSVYDGTKWKTVATTSPMSRADIKEIEQAVRDQRAQMEKIFEAQRKLFDEQFKLFENIFGSEEASSNDLSWNNLWKRAMTRAGFSW